MKRLVLVFALVILAIVVVACSTPAPTPMPPTAAPAAATKAPAPTSAPAAPAATSAPAASALPDLKGRALKVGSDTTYPPFESVDKDKKIVGFDVELVGEICKKVNCTASFNTADFDGLMIAVNNKTYDFSASGWTMTDERAKTVDFSLPYMPNTEVLVVRADESRFKEPEDLKKPEYIVATQLGTTNAVTAKKLVTDANKQVKEFQDFPSAVAALMNKQADAVVIDTFAASSLLDDNKGKIKIAGKQFGSEFLGLVFRKGDKELKDAFDAGLKAAYKDGTWTKLCEKWWKDIEPKPDCAGKLLADKLGK
jgi:polar amino acid transport system substrate-binding protein